MRHLREIRFGQPAPELAATFPFNVPPIARLLGDVLSFPTEVTILVGENGCGKSTLLEALAAAAGSVTVGSEAAERDRSLDHIRPLASLMRLIWSVKTRRGFFMRAEDFFGYTRRLHTAREEMEAEVKRIQADPHLTRTQRGLALQPYGRELGALRRSYGAGLDAISHGESFLALFQSRFVPGGLYLLDEPEAPLSPLRQLALVALIQECAVQREAQFIIATHSPVVMAIPGATMYSLDEGRITPIAFEQAEHVRFLRDFLNHPQRYLEELRRELDRPDDAEGRTEGESQPADP
jgi:predicted ATPase